jgi:hypothetical protein
MTEIIEFPRHPGAEDRRRMVEERARENEENLRLQALEIEQRRALLERARKARSQRRKMSDQHGSERRKAARNLWDILERLENGPRRIRKAEVLLAAGKAAEGDSTKHLERYALRPGLSEAEERKRSIRLVQAIQPYVDLARKAAELEGSDPDVAELEVLNGTRYVSDLPLENADEPDARAADVMAEALRRLAERLAHRFQLQRFFDQCEQHRLVPHHPDAHEPMLVVSEAATLSGFRLPQTITGHQVKALDRCPGAYLGSVTAGDAIIRKAAGVAEFQGPPNKNNGVPVALQVRLIPTWDVYIRIAPVGAQKNPQAILDIRPITRVKALKDGYCITLECEEPEPVWVTSSITIGEFSGHDVPDKNHAQSIRLDGITPFHEQPEYNSGNIFINMRVLPRPPMPPPPPSPVGVNTDYREPPPPPDVWPTAVSPLPPPAPVADLLIASSDVMLDVLRRPLFFRHHEDKGATPIGASWTDERPYDEPYSEPDYYNALEATPQLAPTVASEGTILARLERWLRGDMPFKKFDDSGTVATGGTILFDRLEDELEARIVRFMRARDVALESAERSLRLLLAPPHSKTGQDLGVSTEASPTLRADQSTSSAAGTCEASPPPREH